VSEVVVALLACACVMQTLVIVALVRWVVVQGDSEVDTIVELTRDWEKERSTLLERIQRPERVPIGGGAAQMVAPPSDPAAARNYASIGQITFTSPDEIA
jgi:hypothetical protein